jgi:phosphoglycerol transferase MdoB-like AlkP superfamily enzyme/glycerophosphoryl diester phosphodiesterase
MDKHRSIILFALLYSACLTGIRHFIILEKHLEMFNMEYPFRMILGGISEFTVGFLFGSLLLSMQRKILADICFVLGIGLTLFFEIACFHYESVFGRLPASDLLFYIKEIKHLAPSLNVNLPMSRVLIEFVVIMLVLYPGFRSLRTLNQTGISKLSGAIAISVILLSVIVQSAPALLSDRYFWSSRQPLVWLAQSHFIRQSYQLENLKLTSEHFEAFRKLHGTARSGPLLNPEYPFCDMPSQINGIGNGRNIILLILEGVGREEMYGKFQSFDVMSNLQRIANENLMFWNVHAPGTKSVSALPAIFSGVPGNPFNNYLWNRPSITLTGFPELLNRQGYATAYFHGGDLSFERQRIFLSDIGFKEIDEYNPAGDAPRYGWGYDDGVMFRKLENWIGNKQQAGHRYLAALFTLSTHDPYILPDDWRPRFPAGHDLAESYLYLDQQLGEFYDWYKLHGDGAILVITGDHTPQLEIENYIVEKNELRFDVPLIIAGLSSDELERYRPYSDRIAGLHDLPATILALLEMEPQSCDLGVNLVQPDATWPADRVVYAFGGDTLERMHMWFIHQEIVFDRLREEFRPANRDDRAIRTETGTAELFNKARSYVNILLPVHYYLLQANRYAISTEKREFRSIQGLKRPILVSHRGNLNGESPPYLENSAAALDAVVNSEFKWVEIDVQLTSDGELVLIHDPHVIIDGREKPVIELTLQELRAIPDFTDILTLEEALARYSDKINLLIEVKPQKRIKHLSLMSREVTRILSHHPDKRRFIIDSFDEYLAASIKFSCACEVGLDTEYARALTAADMEYIAQLRVDWIYVHYSVVNEELLSMAHRYGLKVMAYTVNDPVIIAKWQSSGTLPDGIITDYQSMIAMVE